MSDPTLTGDPPGTRPCPVCGTGSETASLFLAENIDPDRMSGFSFASRKAPEYMSHCLVKCPTCDLVYVHVPPTQTRLAQAYHQAEFDSHDEADDAARAYARAIEPVLARLTSRQSALEIGTGTGIFLDYLSAAGFETVVGVEPSTAAIEAAPSHRRAWIREGIFVENDFAPESFDLICCFMTLEHVLDPGSLARSALRLLRPGGALVTVTHDYQAPVNRILGKKSPIIDIEHMQLFTARSLRELFARSGFETVSVRGFRNRYALRYWARLAPLPGIIGRLVMGALSATGAADWKLAVNVGNLITSGTKPR